MKIIGQSKYGEIVRAEMDGNKIKSLSSGHIEHPDNTYDGNTYFTEGSWGGDYTVNGIIFKRGMELAENFEPFFSDDETKRIILEEDFYEAHGSYCSDCGTFHDTEQYHNVSFTILNDCELYCKDCVGADDLIAETPVESVDDIYKAKDITGMSESPENFEEVHTIFHDCGWGGPATSHDQSIKIVDDLLAEYGELYAGLTGIGQFQVYVTLYKKTA
jgi:hypothetical protein